MFRGLFAVACVVALVAAFLPVFKGESLNVVFLGAAVVFLVLGLVVGKRRPTS